MTLSPNKGTFLGTGGQDFNIQMLGEHNLTHNTNFIYFFLQITLFKYSNYFGVTSGKLSCSRKLSILKCFQMYLNVIYQILVNLLSFSQFSVSDYFSHVIFFVDFQTFFLMLLVVYRFNTITTTSFNIYLSIFLF